VLPDILAREGSWKKLGEKPESGALLPYAFGKDEELGGKVME
jgi:hypothetical protein